MGESYDYDGDVVDKLVRAVGGKFSGLGFDEWIRTAFSVISSRNKGIKHILNGQQCPVPVYRQDRGLTRGRKTRGRNTPAVTRGETSEAADLEGEKPTDIEEEEEEEATEDTTPGSKGPQETGGRKAPSTPVPASIMWTDDDSITNLHEIRKWHEANVLLYDVLFLSTKGAAGTFLLKYRPAPGTLANGKEAWDGLIAKYQNSTRQRRRQLYQRLTSTTMPVDQDPDVFINTIYLLRDELIAMGEIIHDDRLLDMILEGLPDGYDLIKNQAASDDTFSLDTAVYTMRNIYSNRLGKNGLSQKLARGRESAMAASNTRPKCNYCNKIGHTENKCFKKMGSTGGADSSAQKTKWCSLHKTHRHDNSECYHQQQDYDGHGRYIRDGSQQRGENNPHYNQQTDSQGAHANSAVTSSSTNLDGVLSTSSRSITCGINDAYHGANLRGINNPQYQQTNLQGAHANSAVTPTSTTLVEHYQPPPAASPAASTTPITAQYQLSPAVSSAAFTTLITAPQATSSPPNGIGFSFAAAPSSSTIEPNDFTMTADSGASSHFIDNRLLHGIERRMIDYVHLNPPVTIKVAGNHLLSGVGKGTLVVLAKDQRGINHAIRLPVTVVPGLGRHLQLKKGQQLLFRISFQAHRLLLPGHSIIISVYYIISTHWASQPIKDHIIYRRSKAV